ncbi:MAG: ATP-dependent RecD-like DNA helicase [Pseudomonadota bacterium]
MPSSTDAPHTKALEVLEGVLDRIVVSKEETDFMVGRLQVRGRREPVQIVGLLPMPHPGETLVLKGKWEINPQWGEQFRFVEVETKAPSTVKGIERYLSSKFVKGIGPEMARRITAVFGEDTLDVIEGSPEDLLKVPGIGKGRARVISDAFKEHRSIRDVMVFLQTHGVSPTYAYKIYKKYGAGAIEAVSANPYRLAMDIRGIGFLSADRVAGSMGVDMKSPLRAQAGILHVLDAMQSEGHVYYPSDSLLAKAWDLLGIGRAGLEDALGELAARRHVVIEEDRVYPSMMWSMEKSVADKVLNLITSPRLLPPIKVDAAVEWVETRSGLSLSQAQREALVAGVNHKALVITGGPGTGKTTILRLLLDILDAKRIRVMLAAPTGRAAKRLYEATGREAKTIHRLLEYSGAEGGFMRTASKPLDADYVVVDEVSMMDVTLAHCLLSALHPNSSLLLVGDADQLPSVGPGNILGDLIRSGSLPVVRLDTVFRQAQASLIVTNAHRVNRGEMPMGGPDGAPTDFYLIERSEPEEALRVIREVVTRRIPERFGLNPFTDVQVLTPMRRGTLGTENLNRELRELLNKEGRPIRGDGFKVGDRVMQTRNNYDKEVFNGDVGRINSYDPESNEAVVDFDGKEVKYHVSELDELIPAYAVTIHKAQGSEYPAVVIPLSTQHFVLLRRNLLYTAMTRGKKLVVLVAHPKALTMAVENSIVEPRNTYLAERLMGRFSG